jgi:hypothetical protein
VSSSHATNVMTQDHEGEVTASQHLSLQRRTQSAAVNNSLGVRSVCDLQFVLWLPSCPAAISNRKWSFHFMQTSHNENTADWKPWAVSEGFQQCTALASMHIGLDGSMACFCSISAGFDPLPVNQPNS